MAEHQEIKAGQKATLFEAESTNGKISLEDYGGKYTVLYFYPKDMTPGCTVQAHEFMALYKEFQKERVEIIGVSKDDMPSHHKFCENVNITYPLITDTEGKICHEYGAIREKVNFGKKYIGIVRSTVIIGKDLRIYKIWKTVRAKGHAEKVLGFIQASKKLDKTLGKVHWQKKK